MEFVSEQMKNCRANYGKRNAHIDLKKRLEADDKLEYKKNIRNIEADLEDDRLLDLEVETKTVKGVPKQVYLVN